MLHSFIFSEEVFHWELLELVKDFWFESKFYFTIIQKSREIILLRDVLYLLEIGKIILANNFSYYLNSVYIFANFDRNLWNLERRGIEECFPNKSLTKEIYRRDNSNTNVLKNDLDLIDVKTLGLLHSSIPLTDYPI